MEMKQREFTVYALLLLIFGFIPAFASAQSIEGKVTDADSGEPLIGVMVVLDGTDRGTMTEPDGSYRLSVPAGTQGILALYYIGYQDLKSEPFTLASGQHLKMDFRMKADQMMLADAVIVERKNAEAAGVLMNDRKIATQAIENIGAAELSIKGLGNVAEAVGTMSGISFNNSGQLFVRGLGDRYSLTTLNGLPIASPNPDNKLIPLDIFSSSVLKNITVTKVFTATSFADYSGAHIDIATKENAGRSFLSVSAGTSGKIGTTFADFYTADRKGWLLKDNNLDPAVKEMDLKTFNQYIRDNDPFGTDFSIRKGKSIPVFNGSVSGGHTFRLRNGDEISLLGSASLSQDNQTIPGGYIANLNAQGIRMDAFSYDGYERRLDFSGLASANYLFRNGDHIGYTMLYAKTATDEYKLRDGFDAEGNRLLGSNSLAHSYSLWTNQIGGSNTLTEHWNLDWNVSFSQTESNEPDRRQVMYRRQEDGTLSLFKLNRQETMRYFGELSERELVADIRPVFSFGEKNRLVFGAAYKDKSRDYESVRFYYNLSNINPAIIDIYNPDFLNSANIADGLITVNRDAQPKNNYYAGHRILAGFAEVEYYPADPLLVSLGLRYEYSSQWVRYWTDAALERISVLEKGDLFPALNLKYSLNETSALRLSGSMTVTRPSFIEMAPFLYKESYGSAEIRGNDKLQNGYNWNFDLKYEYFSRNNRHMFSVGAYYKILKSPIERVQESSGGSLVHSFRNAEQGIAAGLEAEFKVEPVRRLSFGGNVSLMYTDVTLLANGGIYTDSRRALQGASPYLGNAFVTYAPEFRNGSSLAATILYNVQGPRIHTVGTYGLGNVMQQPIHSIDANIRFRFDERWSIEVSLTNLLDQEYAFIQDVPETGEKIRTESYRLGRGAGLSVRLDF